MRHVCIHGHFYQPPRENPWLDRVERQKSASPFHDWNERITDECYVPNAAVFLPEEGGRGAAVVNNYARMSFDFGPTLLRWMERSARPVYEAVLEADHEGRERFGGHGPAIAQAYGHAILPLCNQRDAVTQLRWGIRDFEHRFGRPPEGMWLPETAVDTRSLEILADLGIRYTILAPYQAQRFRRFGDESWRPVDRDRGIDSHRAYRVALPSGADLAVFFYDGILSADVAFGELARSGSMFTERLLAEPAGEDGAESDPATCDSPPLVHLAVDGETFGHHQKPGERSLAEALTGVEESDAVKLTVYGEFLERFPPEHEVEIREDSSWSCSHGVERWRADCGCNTGGEAGWTQAWRAPLRDALDWLRDELAASFEAGASAVLDDPWEARNGYIDVLLDDSPGTRTGSLERHASRLLDADEQATVWKWLESQRHALLMFASCGWFFSDLSGIETVQVLRHAARAVQLNEQAGGGDLEEGFLARLAPARSNRSSIGDAPLLWANRVVSLRVD